jgi:hypothetical protein
MKSSALQNFVRKIHSDEKVRAQFVSNPERVLARFKLNEDEKQAILGSYYKLGLVSSNSSQLEAVIEPTSWWFSPVP